MALVVSLSWNLSKFCLQRTHLLGRGAGHRCGCMSAKQMGGYSDGCALPVLNTQQLGAISSWARSAAKLQSLEASLHRNEAWRSSRRKAGRKEKMEKKSIRTRIICLWPNLTKFSPDCCDVKNMFSKETFAIRRQTWTQQQQQQQQQSSQHFRFIEARHFATTTTTARQGWHPPLARNKKIRKYFPVFPEGTMRFSFLLRIPISLSTYLVPISSSGRDFSPNLQIFEDFSNLFVRMFELLSVAVRNIERSNVGGEQKKGVGSWDLKLG